MDSAIPGLPRTAGYFLAVGCVFVFDLMYDSTVREKDRIVPGSTSKVQEPLTGVGNRPSRLPTADPLLRVFLLIGQHGAITQPSQRFGDRCG